jgi:hypothetical protein
MKSRKPKIKKLIPPALVVLGALVLLVGLVFYWQPIATFAQTTLQNLQEQLYLPLVMQTRVTPSPAPTEPSPTPTVQPREYVVISWNDLGMHCYNRDFKDLAVLPPFNTLWAQVIRRGDPPEIVTSGVTVSYNFPDNTYSAGKSNFWDYDLQLFGVDLPIDIGLYGKGLSGTMDLQGDHFEAVGIPLTEFSDSAPTTRQPYQLANIVVTDSKGATLASNQVVAPVSTEMHCDYCHFDNGPGNEDVATGVIEQNILTKHDQENMDEYPPDHQGALMARRPILCAECHSSNALGAPGVPGLPSLSNAMHEKHAGKVPDSTTGCYNCHPGPDTKCLRDVMSSVYGLQCNDCHGGMEQVSQNTNPWLHEPRCDGCHTEPGYTQDQALYRHSKGHGGMYCESCHDSTHAIAPSTQSLDAIKFINLQGHKGVLDTCTVCHLTQPTEGGPHK